jgi:hypothetical protein
VLNHRLLFPDLGHLRQELIRDKLSHTGYLASMYALAVAAEAGEQFWVFKVRPVALAVIVILRVRFRLLRTAEVVGLRMQLLQAGTVAEQTVLFVLRKGDVAARQDSILQEDGEELAVVLFEHLQ